MITETIAFFIMLFTVVIQGAALGIQICSLRNLSALNHEFSEQVLRTPTPPPPPPENDEFSACEIAYIESVLKQLIEELKKGNYIRQDFRFDTKEERFARVEKLIDDFLKRKEGAAKS